MLSKMRKMDNKGFTLIELMIVIAIIGILAAIAIPNFIAYRNKTFCSATESDANSIAASIADYFSIPTNTTLNDTDNLGIADELSNKNTWSVNASDVDNIWITVNDVTTRCPEDYRTAMAKGTSPRGYWEGNAYKKNMSMD